MEAALDINPKLCLDNILGFNAAKRKFIAREGYVKADTLVDWYLKHIKQWCDEVSKYVWILVDAYG